MPFASYAAQDVDHESAVPIVLNDLTGARGAPKIYVVHTGRKNRAWAEAALLDAEGEDEPIELGAARKPQLPSEADDARAMDKLRRRLAAHAVRKLENVWHDDGRAADKPEDVLEFMLAIPYHVVLAIFRFVERPANFIMDSDPKPAATAQAVAQK